jgi:hypothetical protein
LLASKPVISFNLLLLAMAVSALISAKYLGIQSDVLLTCSVRAITNSQSYFFTTRYDIFGGQV